MYGEPTNPIPYIFAAYAISALLILGYAAWIIWHRRQTQVYLSTLSPPGTDIGSIHTLSQKERLS